MPSSKPIDPAENTATMELDTTLAIVDVPFDAEKTEQPFGKRWGGKS